MKLILICPRCGSTYFTRLNLLSVDNIAKEDEYRIKVECNFCKEVNTVDRLFIKVEDNGYGR